jgi:hypothetical protein
VPKHQTTVRVQRHCQELDVMLEWANEEQKLLIAQVSEQKREKDELKLKNRPQ